MGKLMRQLPEHNLYVELFSGSKSKLFDKLPVTSEVYNDTNGDITDLFEVIRMDAKRFFYFVDGGKKAEDGLKADKWERLKEIYLDFKSGGRKGNLDIITGYRPISREVRKELAEFDKDLSYIIGRLRAVQLEGRRFDDILERFDGKKTVFYADVSRLPEDVEDAELVERLLSVDGNCIVFGAQSEEYELLIDEGWQKIEDDGVELWLSYRV